jgi:prevent-host-death family protein
MIIANITEIKNRLSHYLRLVQGGEQVEIIDRKTPLAKIVGVSDSPDLGKDASWVKKMYDLGIVIPPRKKKALSDFSSIEHVPSCNGKVCGALKALLDERNVGR